MKYVNKNGLPADPKLESPDLAQCQAFPNMAKWSWASFGPKPKPVRCTSAPICVVVENEPAKDGSIGSMSMCITCLALYLDAFGDRSRVNPL